MDIQWYADGKDFADNLEQDLKVREYLRKKLKQASVSRIQIERPARSAHITIHTARPGMVIGKRVKISNLYAKRLAV